MVRAHILIQTEVGRNAQAAAAEVAGITRMFACTASTDVRVA